MLFRLFSSHSRGNACIRNLEHLNKLCNAGPLNEALETAEILQLPGTIITRNHVYNLLQEAKHLEYGRRVQSLMLHNGLDSIAVLGDHLIRLFTEHESLHEANEAFSKIAKPSAYTWSAIVLANARLGQAHIALELYHRMQTLGVKRDNYIYVAVVKASAVTKLVAEGMIVHDHVKQDRLESDVVVGTTLIYMYATCGNMEAAWKVLENLPDRNVVSWSAMIAGYAQHGQGFKALQCFEKMQNEGVEPNVVSWNALISGYSQHDQGILALECFEKMEESGMQPNEITFTSIVNACASIGAIQEGRLIHSRITRSKVKLDVVGNALVDMYAKCGSLEEACFLFHTLPNRDIVSWNAMIAGYAQHEEGILALEYFEKMQEEGIKPNVISWNAMISGFVQHGECILAFKCFEKMQLGGLKPDEVTYLSMLKACASIGAIEKGRFIHKQLTEHSLETDAFVQSTLVDMYVKCGSLKEADQVFKKSPNRNVVLWTSMIAGYAQHGEGLRALKCFKEMQLEGINPNDVAFTIILIACCHGGLVDEGHWFYMLMEACWGIMPTISHSTCMVDLLGRAGCLNEAKDLLQASMQVSIVAWMSLLSACRLHLNAQVGRQCFDEIVSLDSSYGPAYVLMGNIYANSYMWKELENMRKHIMCLQVICGGMQ